MQAPPGPGFKLPYIIEVQALNCGATDACLAFQLEAIARPAEMSRPSLPAGVEKGCCFLGHWVDARLKTQFLKLAAVATQGKVRQKCQSAAPLGHDMVQAKAMRKETFGSMAILTTIASTSGYSCIESPQIGLPTGHLTNYCWDDLEEAPPTCFAEVRGGPEPRRDSLADMSRSACLTAAS
jgi:hypothetical protein